MLGMPGASAWVMKTSAVKASARAESQKMGIMEHFHPGAVEAARQAYPDTLMHDATQPWPPLAGTLGVFFTSRSGSTVLSRFAERHFMVSNVGESINSPILRVRMRRQKLASFPAALKRHMRQNSPADWYMFKAGPPGLLNAARIGFLEEYGPVLRPVLLLRRDIISQALSLFAANRTKRYHSNQEEAHKLREEDYDYRSIERYLVTIQRGNFKIHTIIRRLGHQMQPLLYEEFKDGDFTIAKRVFAEAGLPLRDSPIQTPEREVTRNTHPLTQYLRERFIADLSGHARLLISDHELFVDKRLAERR